MWLLTVRDLLYRRRQVAIAVVGSALVFAMALVLAGLAGGFRAEAQRTVDAVGADGFVVASGAGGPFTSLAALPADAADAVRAGPGDTGPLVVVPQALRGPGGQVDVHLIGHEPRALGAPPLVSGRAAVRPGEAAVDRRTGLRTGDQFTVGRREFVAVGETEGLTYAAGVPNVYVPLGDAQAVAFAGRPVVTAVAVRGLPPDLPPGLTLIESDAARADLLRPLRTAVRAVDNSVGFLWVVAAILLGAVSYLSVLDRLRDFAVLKAIGVPGFPLYAGLAIQAALTSLVSAVLAIGMSRLLAPLMPMPLAIPATAVALLPLVAVLVGLVASLSGLRQVARVDPALAFAGR